ncbi:MAG: hypothetical protein JW804_00275 [Sedimentisphaerales bacterium]|nr:hypothetical protein [Sedimentisphaerales bacterium]
MQAPCKKIADTNHSLLLLITAGLGWAIPGAGYWFIGQYKRAIIVFVTITLTFTIGIYVGSIGVIDSVTATPGILGRINPWFLAQVLNSAFVFLISNITASGGYPVYGKPEEIGQLYTSISGLLNLLCIINCVYAAHTRYFSVGAEDRC